MSKACTFRPLKRDVNPWQVSRQTDLLPETWTIENEKIGLDSVRRIREPLTLKKSWCTKEPIAFALRDAESGVPVEEVCHKLGISQ